MNFLNLRNGALRINCDAIASVEVSGETVAVALMNERVHFFSGADAAAVLSALEPNIPSSTPDVLTPVRRSGKKQ